MKSYRVPATRLHDGTKHGVILTRRRTLGRNDKRARELRVNVEDLGVSLHIKHTRRGIGRVVEPIARGGNEPNGRANMRNGERGGSM